MGCGFQNNDDKKKGPRTRVDYMKKYGWATRDELHKRTIVQIMQGANPTKSTGIQAAVLGLKVCSENVDKLSEAIEQQKRSVTTVLRRVRHETNGEGSYIDPMTGKCLLDAKSVECQPALNSRRVADSYFQSIAKLNDTYSNCDLSEAVVDMTFCTQTMDSGVTHRFITSLGLVPNKRMTNQGAFNNKCEFGSMHHDIDITQMSDSPVGCIFGGELKKPEQQKISGKYAGHPFYQRFITEALHNLAIQSGRLKKVTDAYQLPDNMQRPIVEEPKKNPPTVIYTGYGVIRIYKSSQTISHDYQNPIDYAIPTMTEVYKTSADIDVITITFTPVNPNKSTGYLQRAYTDDSIEYVVAQHVNYKCTYRDMQKAHLPDVELKLVTVNYGATISADQGKDISAIVHEFGNGPATQYNIKRLRPTHSFFGFGIPFASEYIHKSTMDALHFMVKKVDSTKTNDQNIFRTNFSKWNCKVDLAHALLVNLKKNITPNDIKKDDPDDPNTPVNRRLNASFSKRELGVIASGTEEYEFGRLCRGESFSVVTPVARSFDEADLMIWIPDWDKQEKRTPAGSVRPSRRTTPFASRVDFDKCSVVSDSSFGVNMDEILFMASQPSEFDA
jgi:hypothetical protein